MHKYNFNFVSHECINYQDERNKGREREGGREGVGKEGRKKGRNTHTHIHTYTHPRDSWDYKVPFILGVRTTNI